jgi:subtilisin-like proprotein convertase family protein
VKSSLGLMLAVSCFALIACGPAGRPNNGGGDDTGTLPDSSVCQPTAGSEVSCGDGVDDDCDGRIDCRDPDCSGAADGPGGMACPICGQVQHPIADPLALPDGNGAGPPYTNNLHFAGFGANQTFNAAGNILKVCVNMEHSWIRDLQIELHAPDFANNGKKSVLQLQLGNTGSEIYLGQANDADSANSPVPGIGADYCWSPTATNPPMLDYANMGGAMLDFNGHQEMPPGDYRASGGFDTLIGAPLNGDWTIFVQDLWGIDNGYIFEWSIAFDPHLVETCDDPIIQ